MPFEQPLVWNRPGTAMAMMSAGAHLKAVWSSAAAERLVGVDERFSMWRVASVARKVVILMSPSSSL